MGPGGDGGGGTGVGGVHRDRGGAVAPRGTGWQHSVPACPPPPPQSFMTGNLLAIYIKKLTPKYIWNTHLRSDKYRIFHL